MCQTRQDLLHRLALGQLVDELVEVADLLHQRIVDVLDADAAHDPGDRRGVRVELGLGEERPRTSSAVEVLLQRRVVVPGEPLITWSNSAFVRPLRSTLVT